MGWFGVGVELLKVIGNVTIVGVAQFEFHHDVWHQKTRVPVLLHGIENLYFTRMNISGSKTDGK